MSGSNESALAVPHMLIALIQAYGWICEGALLALLALAPCLRASACDSEQRDQSGSSADGMNRGARHCGCRDGAVTPARDLRFLAD